MTEQFVPCVIDNDYEIETVFPHRIRKISNHKIVSEFDNGNGYIRVNLNGDKYYKHVIVACQFIENPDPENLTEVDHLNHIRYDNRIENLRYVTRSENAKNRGGTNGVIYEFIEENDLPDDLTEVRNYGAHEFEDIYYSEELDRFIFYNGINYRLLHINYNQNGTAFVNASDTEGRRVKIYYSKFKKIYGFI